MSPLCLSSCLFFPFPKLLFLSFQSFFCLSKKFCRQVPGALQWRGRAPCLGRRTPQGGVGGLSYNLLVCCLKAKFIVFWYSALLKLLNLFLEVSPTKPLAALKDEVAGVEETWGEGGRRRCEAPRRWAAAEIKIFHALGLQPQQLALVTNQNWW